MAFQIEDVVSRHKTITATELSFTFAASMTKHDDGTWTLQTRSNDTASGWFLVEKQPLAECFDAFQGFMKLQGLS